MEVLILNIKKEYRALMKSSPLLMRQLYAASSDSAIARNQFQQFLLPIDRNIKELIREHFIDSVLLINGDEIIYKEVEWQPIKMLIQENTIIINAPSQLNPFSLFFSTYFPDLFQVPTFEDSKRLLHATIAE